MKPPRVRCWETEVEERAERVEVKPKHSSESDSGIVALPEAHAESNGDVPPLFVYGLAAAVVVVAATVCCLWGAYLVRGRIPFGAPTPRPIIRTVTPRPTATHAPLATIPPTDESWPTVSPGIAVGQSVRVFGTGGSGLNLREGPGENYPRIGVAEEGTTFLVVQGPVAASSLDWWQVTDAEQGGAQVWVVANYLEPVDHP